MAETLQLPAVIQASQIQPGMTIRVHHKIKDTDAEGKEKERIQMFEGMVLHMGGSGPGKTLTLRRVASGVGVEKIFPLTLPSIVKIELVRMVKTRRANIGFVRGSKKRLKEIHDIKLRN